MITIIKWEPRNTLKTRAWSRLQEIWSRLNNRSLTPIHILVSSKMPRSKLKLSETGIEAEAETRVKLRTTTKLMGEKPQSTRKLDKEEL